MANAIQAKPAQPTKPILEGAMQVRIQCELELPDETAVTPESIQARMTDFLAFLTQDCGLEATHAAALLYSMADSLGAEEEPDPDPEYEMDGEAVERAYGAAEAEIKQLEQYKALAKLEKQCERAERLDQDIELLGLAAEMFVLIPDYYLRAREIAAKHAAWLPISFGRDYFLSDVRDDDAEEERAARRIYISEPMGLWRDSVFMKFGFSDGFRAKAAAIKLIHEVTDNEVFDRALANEVESADFHGEMLAAINKLVSFTSKELAAELGYTTTQVSGKLNALVSMGIIEKRPPSKGLLQYVVVPEMALRIETARARARETLKPLLTVP